LGKEVVVNYNRTEIDVKLGDRVLYRHLFIGRSYGVVAYLPGVSKLNPRIIPHQWVVRLTNGKGIFMLHTEDLEFAHRRVEFLGRGSTELAITPDEAI
jgi:hypothetical protein